jgi:DNA-binding IclR family transcriptional regulator
MNLLSRHGRTLAYLGEHPTSRVSDVARHLGVTESNAWHLIDDLVKAGAVRRIKGGRQNTYVLVTDAVIAGDLTYSVGDFMRACATIAPANTTQQPVAALD